MLLYILVHIVAQAARERGDAMAGVQRMRTIMQKLRMSTLDRQRDPEIALMLLIEALKVDIERWREEIKVHRSGFLLSDRQRGFGAAFMKEINAAHRALNALTKAIKGKQCCFYFSFPHLALFA